MLNMQIERHKNNKDAKYQNHFAMNNMLKALKLEYPWLKQADSTSLQNANHDLDDAFQRFFKYAPKRYYILTVEKNVYSLI